MKMTIPGLLVLCLVLAATQVLALDKPTITSPHEGATLGPNYDVTGSMPNEALLVVMTDVVNCDTNEVVRSVPGIRHVTEPNGSFHFRVSSPRVYLGEKDLPLAYRVRVYEATRDQMGDEATVNTQCVKPTEDQAMSIIPTGNESSDMTAPTITSPQEGSAVGPSYEVMGKAEHRAFLVVLTDVIDTGTGEVIRTVPGIRHWTDMDGSFQFRVASPRAVMGDASRPLTYRVRVFELADDIKGPEASVSMSMSQE